MKQADYKESDKREDDESSTQSEKNLLEWIVFGISSILVLALLGYLVVMSFHMEQKPPELLVQGTRDSTDLSILRYKIHVINTGDITAEEVKVQVTLTGPEGEKEKGELTFPFIPHYSEREGWYQFSKPGVKGDVAEFQVVSYRKP